MSSKTTCPVQKKTNDKKYNAPPGFLGANSRRTNNVIYKISNFWNWKSIVPPTRQQESSTASRPVSAAPNESNSSTFAKRIKSTNPTAFAMALQSNTAGNQPVSSSKAPSRQRTPDPLTPPPSSSPLLQTDLEIFADVLSPTVSSCSKGKGRAQTEDIPDLTAFINLDDFTPKKAGTTSSHDDPNVGLQSLSETITDAGKNLKDIVSSETDSPVFISRIASTIEGWGDRLTSLVLRLGQIEQNRILDVVAAIDREEEMVQKHRAELEAKDRQWEAELLKERKMWEAKLAGEVRKRQDVEKLLPKQRKRAREEEEGEEEGEECTPKKRKKAKAESVRS